MDILLALLSLPQEFAGDGVNHEGEKFRGALRIEPLVGGTAIMLHYTATLMDGRQVHAEATLLARNEQGKLCLWPVMQELAAVIPHVEVGAVAGGCPPVTATFASGPREALDVFREEIAISQGDDASLTYAHSWGLPHGQFAARSSCKMSALAP